MSELLQATAEAAAERAQDRAQLIRLCHDASLRPRVRQRLMSQGWRRKSATGYPAERRRKLRCCCALTSGRMPSASPVTAGKRLKHSRAPLSSGLPQLPAEGAKAMPGGWSALHRGRGLPLFPRKIQTRFSRLDWA